MWWGLTGGGSGGVVLWHNTFTEFLFWNEWTCPHVYRRYRELLSCLRAGWRPSTECSCSQCVQQQAPASIFFQGRSSFPLFCASSQSAWLKTSELSRKKLVLLLFNLYISSESVVGSPNRTPSNSSSAPCDDIHHIVVSDGSDYAGTAGHHRPWGGARGEKSDNSKTNQTMDQKPPRYCSSITPSVFISCFSTYDSFFNCYKSKKNRRPNPSEFNTNTTSNRRNIWCRAHTEHRQLTESREIGEIVFVQEPVGSRSQTKPLNDKPAAQTHRTTKHQHTRGRSFCSGKNLKSSWMSLKPSVEKHRSLSVC